MMRRVRDARGFSLIETMVAVAVFVTIVAIGLQLMLASARGLSSVRQGGSNSGQQSLTRFADQLRADARSAFAVDIAGGTGNPATTEVLFYGQDDKGTKDYWSYAAVGNQVYRKDYGPGLAGALTAPNPPLPAPVSISLVANLTGLSVSRMNADRLADPTVNPGYATALASFASAKCYDVPTTPVATGPCGSTYAGGNHVVAVTIAGPNGAETVHLVAGTLPSSFTIRVSPTAHVVVYRLDSAHQIGLGLGHKTFSDVMGSVSLSWNNGPYVPWCPAMMIYARAGSGPSGLLEGAPNKLATYNQSDVNEQPTTLVQKCAAGSPPPQANATALAGVMPPPATFDPPPPGAPLRPGYLPPPGVYADRAYCNQYAGLSPLCTASGLPIATPPPGPSSSQMPPPIIFLTPSPSPASPPDLSNSGGGG